MLYVDWAGSAVLGATAPWAIKHGRSPRGRGLFRSAGRLNIVVVQSGVEGRCQTLADDDDPGRHAVVTAMQNVPDEHGGS